MSERLVALKADEEAGEDVVASFALDVGGNPRSMASEVRRYCNHRRLLSERQAFEDIGAIAKFAEDNSGELRGQLRALGDGAEALKGVVVARPSVSPRIKVASFDPSMLVQKASALAQVAECGMEGESRGSPESNTQVFRGDAQGRAGG